MSSTYGENIKVTVFGESHSTAIGVTIEGLPSGSAIDLEALSAFLKRRMPGNNAYSTARKETDIPEFLCGMKDGFTCGTPLTAIIRNRDAHSKDYESIKNIPRPGHADYTATVKYGGFANYAGGGHFSGRLTAPLCIAGGICLQLLKKEGIEVFARAKEIGGIKDEGDFSTSVADREFPAVSNTSAEKMKEIILQKKNEGDSLGGVIECKVTGLPAGLGDPMFDGMENRIAAIIFGIPAVKGIEFGEGFEAARLCGSENNDSFCIQDGKVVTKTNHAGGILGGITNGMPLLFRVAIKPTPSISKIQKSVDLSKMEETTLQVSGRHDPCIVPRAVPVVEAAAAIAVYDAFLSRKKELK